MKRFLLLFISLPFLSNIFAQSITPFEFQTAEELQIYGGFQPFAISPDGRYATGSTLSMNGFFYDFKEKKITVITEVGDNDQTSYNCELLAINNDGVAVGYDDNGGIMVDVNGGYKIIQGNEDGIAMAMLSDLTADASVVVGAIADSGWVQRACYWKDGKRVLLDTPTEEEMGFRINGSRAIAISDDGKVIVGYLIDRQQWNPMVLWQLDYNGKYVLNAVCKDYFEGNSQVIYDDNGNVTDIERGDNPFLQFSPGALSANGKTVAMYVAPNNDELMPEAKLGIYYIDKDELEVIENYGGLIQQYSGIFTISGISNEGDIVGVAGDMWMGTMAFYMNGKDKVTKSLAEAFPSIEVLQEYSDEARAGNPFFSSAITPDGKYMLAYIYMGEEFITHSFRIDTGREAVVKSIADQPTDVIYNVFNLQGVKVLETIEASKINNLPSGIYIINGKKVIL